MLIRNTSKGLRSTCASIQSRQFSQSIVRMNRFEQYNAGIFELDSFVPRHIQEDSIQEMLAALHLSSLDELTEKTIPKNILLNRDMVLKRTLPKNIGTVDDWREVGEQTALAELRVKMKPNRADLKSLLGQGYYDTVTPSVILRNLIENPSWYTPYTPYQAEVAQGRLESLLNFQTMVADLTGMDIANASVLDESTAAAEAMTMCYNVARRKKSTFFVSSRCHPTTIELCRVRAAPLGIRVLVGNEEKINFEKHNDIFGVLIQYPDTEGTAKDLSELAKTTHDNGALLVAASDLLACCVLKPPGEFGADIVVGSSQRFGVPLGYGGPNAGFMATKNQLQRQLPGRIIGVSKDSNGNMAYRMALQTREQHIRRDKATSNICTAQALLANVSAMYAVYHGPKGLRTIADAVHKKTVSLAKILTDLGHTVTNELFFDTIKIKLKGDIVSDSAVRQCLMSGFNVRRFDNHHVGISLDETFIRMQVEDIARAFAVLIDDDIGRSAVKLMSFDESFIDKSPLKRTSEYLTHPVFNMYHTEHELMRYMYRLERKDIGLNTSMIPLGSCTMKLNAASEMIPVTWKEVGGIHPYVPRSQVPGYSAMITDLENWLCEITGFDSMSFQPNAGSQGEYAGLRVIKQYHESRGEQHRNICLIPISAHGTNPASAAMCNMKVVPVNCHTDGTIDMEHLKKQIDTNKDNLAAIMITYPSTYGVFEENITTICNLVHESGGQVYLDGANMNAMVGLSSPAICGADVCHLNLHKTFCIPHGGGGPGMGPIGVKSHLAPFLPNHSIVENVGGHKSIGQVSMAPFGSTSILPIVWMYIRMMGPKGLRKATQVAILNANYMVKQLENDYKIYYRGKNEMVAHEFIIDCRPFEKFGIEAEDIAKRLQDFGFHAPTMSFPIPNTLMIEPTESESLQELRRYIQALKTIREEIREVERGEYPNDNNVLVHAPHTAELVSSSKWDRPYPREKAAYPLPWLRASKYWPTVGRVDNAFGDRNLHCTCPPMSDYVSHESL